MSEPRQTLTIQQALDLAVQHHTAGRLSQAENIYQQILQNDPNQPIALHLLGVIAHQTGKNDVAVQFITKSIEIDPDYADAHSNLGKVLKELGRLDEAVVSCHTAIDIKPGFAEAHNNLGTVLRELGKLEDAAAHYHKVLAINPNHVRAQINLLECVYCLGDNEQFYRELETILLRNKTNIGVAAISAFVSQQLAIPDPYPFCKNPLKFVRVYETRDGIDGYDSFLHELTEHLKNIDAIWEPAGKSTRGGFQTQHNNLFDKPSGHLAQLDQILKDKITRYRCDFSAEDCGFITLFPKHLNLSGWFVRLAKGGRQTEHIHTSGWLSGVFYLQTPESVNREEGAIEFGLWGYNLPILNKNYSKRRHHPKSGDLVLFPSSLFHRTIPCHSSEDRMSIAFDLIPA